LYVSIFTSSQLLIPCQFMMHPTTTSGMHGFHVYNSNRMERLAARLAEQLRELQAAHGPLARMLLLVPNQGMKRWVQLQLAEHNGIAANLHFEHLYKFLSGKLFATSGEQAAEADKPRNQGCNRQTLKWQILCTLPALLEQHPAFEMLKQYVAGEAAELRLHQLAARLSEVFDRYQMERPEWLLCWQQNRLLEAQTFSKQPERALQLQAWQQPLWHELYRQGNWHSFADDWDSLSRIFKHDYQALHPELEALRHEYPAGILLFGFSSLSSGLMDILHALSTRIALHFYYFNPCQSYWGDALDRNKSYGLLKKQLHQQYEQQQLLQGNSLLANLAQSGRNFNNALLDIGTLLEQDQFDVITSEQQLDESLLACVQRMVLFNQKQLDARQLARISPLDCSIQFHSCHSARREVEVLKNNLLQLFDKHPELQARDVLVLCSDVNSYAPLVQAIFNQKGSSPAIAVAISDLNLINGNSCVHTLLALLDLAQSQFSLPEVLSILDCSYVAQKFGFSSEELATIANWLGEAGVRWGIDALMRSRRLHTELGNDNSFNQGLADLAFGLVMPPDGSSDACYGDLTAYCGLSGNDANLLGRLLVFLQKIFALQQLAELQLSLPQWQQQLQGLLRDFFAQELFGTKQGSNQAEELQQGLCEFFESMQASLSRLEHYRCGLPALRYELQQALGEKQHQHAFLSGKVTLANITPMRSIPAKVIAVLGLGEGSFPRPGKQSSFNLMAHAPQWLDNNPRESDKQSFLEIVLSARKYLLLSWQGQQHNSRHKLAPASVLAELLDFVSANFAGRGQPYLVEHHLHEMEAAYFDGSDAKLFSFNQHAANAAATLQAQAGQAATQPELYQSAFRQSLQLATLLGQPVAEELQQFACEASLAQWSDPQSDDSNKLQHLQVCCSKPGLPQGWSVQPQPQPAKQPYEALRFELSALQSCIGNPLRYFLRELGCQTSSTLEQQPLQQESFVLDGLGRYKLRQLLSAHASRLQQDNTQLPHRLQRQLQHRAVLPQGSFGELELQQQLAALQLRGKLLAAHLHNYPQSLTLEAFQLEYAFARQSIVLDVGELELLHAPERGQQACLEVFDGKLKEADLLRLLLQHLALNTQMPVQSLAVDMEGNNRILQASQSTLQAANQLGFCLQLFLYAHRRVAAFDAKSALAAKIPRQFANSYDAATRRMYESYKLVFDMDVFAQSTQLASLAESFKELLACYTAKS